jgi:hypothetical protein
MTVNLRHFCPERCFQSRNLKKYQRMAHQVEFVIIGISVGLALGILIAFLVFFGLRWYKKRAHLRRCANEHSIPSTTLPIRTNGLGTSTEFSASLTNSIAIQGSDKVHRSSPRSWWNHQNKDHLASASGILRYSYKYVVSEICLSLNFKRINSLVLLKSSFCGCFSLVEFCYIMGNHEFNDLHVGCFGLCWMWGV